MEAITTDAEFCLNYSDFIEFLKRLKKKIKFKFFFLNFSKKKLNFKTGAHKV